MSLSIRYPLQIAKSIGPLTVILTLLLVIIASCGGERNIDRKARGFDVLDPSKKGQQFRWLSLRLLNFDLIEVGARSELGLRFGIEVVDKATDEYQFDVFNLKLTNLDRMFFLNGEAGQKNQWVCLTLESSSNPDGVNDPLISECDLLELQFPNSKLFGNNVKLTLKKMADTQLSVKLPDGQTLPNSQEIFGSQFEMKILGLPIEANFMVRSFIQAGEEPLGRRRYSVVVSDLESHTFVPFFQDSLGPREVMTTGLFEVIVPKNPDDEARLRVGYVDVSDLDIFEVEYEVREISE